MPLFRALAKNMAASYFGESALRFCNGSYTSVCLYSVTVRKPVTANGYRLTKPTDLSRLVDNLPQAGKINSLRQACEISGCVPSLVVFTFEISVFTFEIIVYSRL